MSSASVLPYGPDAVLVELPDSRWLQALSGLLSGREGVVDLVPAERTMLVRLDREVLAPATFRAWFGAPETQERLVSQLRSFELGDDHAPVVEIPVVYDGEDLAAVAEATGLTVSQVIDLHHSARYRAAFTGFAPGFVYLTGLAAELHLPRRARPRTKVAAGSVAMAAGYSAIYPAELAGGWHLLGRTPLPLWDLRRERPSLISPGDAVRFVPSRSGGSPA